MPIVSQSQRGLMHGIAEGTIPPGRGKPSKAVAKEFVSTDKPGKLPGHVDDKAKRRAVYDHPRTQKRRAED
jgi:hypothetical protein